MEKITLKNSFAGNIDQSGSLMQVTWPFCCVNISA